MSESHPMDIKPGTAAVPTCEMWRYSPLYVSSTNSGAAQLLIRGQLRKAELYFNPRCGLIDSQART